jgi:hypothetical protein
MGGASAPFCGRATLREKRGGDVGGRGSGGGSATQRKEEGVGSVAPCRGGERGGRGAGGQRCADGRHPRPTDSARCGSVLRHAGARDERGGPIGVATAGPLAWAAPKRTVPFCN